MTTKELVDIIGIPLEEIGEAALLLLDAFARLSALRAVGSVRAIVLARTDLDSALSLLVKYKDDKIIEKAVKLIRRADLELVSASPRN